VSAEEAPTGYERTFRQFLQVYIWPEVERRRAAGELSADFRLWAAQVLFYPDGRRNVVRLNGEIRALLRVPVPLGRSVQAGQPVYLRDVVAIDQVQLAEDDDPDAGHITTLALQSGWFLSFDARYNKGLSRRHLDVAREFLAAARSARRLEHWHACVDCLFSAVELGARATLLSIPDKDFRQQTKHQQLKKRFRQWTQMGNIAPEQHEAFNKLSAWRRSARYLDVPLRVEPDAIDNLFNIIESMIHAENERIDPGAEAAE